MNLHNDVAKSMHLEKTLEEIFKLINIANEETIHILIDFIIILSKVRLLTFLSNLNIFLLGFPFFTFGLG